MTYNNARFWVYVNGGAVKLTLRPGQRLEWHRAWSHDEGWSSLDECWEFEDGVLTNHWREDGTDCDGRMTRCGTRSCAASELMAGSPPYFQDGTSQAEIDAYAEVVWPAWQPGEYTQRDEFAEAAGY